MDDIDHRSRHFFGHLGFCVGFLVFAASAKPDAPKGTYQLDSATVASSGAVVSNGTFLVGVTVGQVSVTPAVNAAVDLYPGFWTPQRTPLPVELLWFTIDGEVAIVVRK